MSEIMGESTDPKNWNVLTDKWLGVMRAGAQADVCSPMDALDQASGIRCVTAASPLDLFAAHRFLLTLLYWKAEVVGSVSDVRESLLNGRVPRALLNSIMQAANQFWLFDDGEPFLQDPSRCSDKTKSAGSLYAEFACGTNIAHFHHGDDKAMRLCLSCATAGMVRIVPWTQAGGAGLSPAVHNAPPIVAMAEGTDLATTLGLNLVELAGEAGEVKWTGHFCPADRNARIPYMEAFTWNPRRVHLRSPSTKGVCWRCGRYGEELVGPIVYAKNENTKLNKKGGKTEPFVWEDPSAFYKSDTPNTTIKSYNEKLAASGQDLVGLIPHKDTHPTSVVLSNNSAHHAWRLVIPCTDGKAKTYDHRQLELADLSSHALRALVPPPPLPWKQAEIDGWTDRRMRDSPNGAIAFVRSAVQLLSHADWAVLASAANRPMHESPAAFDLLSGLLWALRGRKVSGLPSRNVAWLVLKLMGTVPSHARVLFHNAQFCPLDVLPKRQPDERRGQRRVRSPYPVSLPRGQRMEAALRGAIDRHLTKRASPSIDWPGLCYRLDQLLD